MAFLLDSGVQISDDGYMYVVEEQNPKDHSLLLPSSETLLKTLYPSTTTTTNDRNNDADDVPSSLLLHELNYVDSLYIQCDVAIRDILKFHDDPDHHKKSEQRRDRVTILQKRQEARQALILQTKRSNDAEHYQHDEERDEKKQIQAAVIRTIRTLNSIRAVFPPLVAMLNHEHRDDKELKIPKEKIMPKGGRLSDDAESSKESGHDGPEEKRRSSMEDELGNVEVALENVEISDQEERVVAVEDDELRNEREHDKDNPQETEQHDSDDTKHEFYSLKRKGKNKPRRWMLGEHVFSIATEGQLKVLGDTMWRVARAFFPCAQKNLQSIDWENILKIIMEREVESRTLRFPPDILAIEGFSASESRERIDRIARRCDELVLHRLWPNRSDKTRHQYHRAVDKLVNHLDSLLVKRYPDSSLEVYGSCLSGLSLGKSSDVDISLQLRHIAEAEQELADGSMSADKYEKLLRKACYLIHGILKNKDKQGFVKIECISRARVPVVKGVFKHAGNPYSNDGSLHFDICFMNDIAVANSSLLSEYASIDPVVRHFLLTVKAWARDNELNSAADNRISSYAWTNMGIAYLQVLGMVPNLQCPELWRHHEFEADPLGNPSHSVNALNTAYLPWETVRQANIWKQRYRPEDMAVSLLLYGFFHYYSSELVIPLSAIAMGRGGAMIPKAVFERCHLLHLCIEDPFETHDSWCPHDLGHPADEAGHKEIILRLTEAETFLRSILLGSEPMLHGQLWETAEGRRKEAEKKKLEKAARKKMKSKSPKKGSEKKSGEDAKPAPKDPNAKVAESDEEQLGAATKEEATNGATMQKNRRRRRKKHGARSRKPTERSEKALYQETKLSEPRPKQENGVTVKW